MRPTLVFIRHCDLGDRAFTHGSELPPHFLSDETIDRMLDSGRLRECPERRSLFRLLHVFSGCAEREPLTQQESDEFALPK
jgi:hypothetical protein